MNAHYTPQHLIPKIKQHLPKQFESVLEPSAGDGALLQAISSKKCKNNVMAFDICDSSIANIRKKFKDKFFSLVLRQQCFLEWYGGQEKKQKFDLILTNPPFSAKRGTWVDFEGRKVPIEIAFIKACIDLLNKNGTLIAILPKSVVSGGMQCSQNIREYLFLNLDIKYCYELTEYEFPSIEGQFYLMIAQKRKQTNHVSIRSFDRPDVCLSVSELRGICYRIDYSYICSREFLRRIYSTGIYQTTLLENICSIYRGSVQPPYNKSSIIHSTTYNGSWNVSTPTIFNKQEQKIYVTYGDILVKRVGRGCLSSFGVISIKRKQLASDCILIIRTMAGINPHQVLFSLRVLFSDILGESYLQRGTGAKYISAEDLSKAPVIRNLYSLYQGEFSAWLNHEKQADVKKMKEVEHSVRSRIFGLSSEDLFNKCSVFDIA